MNSRGCKLALCTFFVQDSGSIASFGAGDPSGSMALVLNECERVRGLGGSFEIEHVYKASWYTKVAIYYADSAHDRAVRLQ